MAYFYALPFLVAESFGAARTAGWSAIDVAGGSVLRALISRSARSDCAFVAKGYEHL